MNIEDKIVQKLMKNAKKASKKGEIPVSAIVINNNKIISSSYNKKEKTKDITAHAEILALKRAAKKLGRWNLNDCTLYVSLKPCSMCFEIIRQSRIENVYFLLDKPYYKKEFDKTKCSLLKSPVSSNTYQQLLSDFFQNKR